MWSGHWLCNPAECLMIDNLTNYEIIDNYKLDVCAGWESCFSHADSLWPWNLPGSSVHGILQARIPEWVAMPSSRECPLPRDQIHVSCGSCNAGRFFASESPGKPINLVLSWPPFSIFKVSNSEQNHSHAQNSSYHICHLSVSLELAWTVLHF